MVQNSILARIGNEASFPSIRATGTCTNLFHGVTARHNADGFRRSRVDRFSLIFPREKREAWFGSTMKFGGRNGGDLRSPWKGEEVITPPRDTNKLDTTMDPGKCAAQI